MNNFSRIKPKKLSKYLASILASATVATMFTTNVFAETAAPNIGSIDIDNQANVTIKYPNAVTEKYSSLQLSFSVDNADNAEVEFVINSELPAKIKEHKYNPTEKILNVYISGTTPLFTTDTINLGQVKVKSKNSEMAKAKIGIVENSLVFVQGNELITVQSTNGFAYSTNLVEVSGEGTTTPPAETSDTPSIPPETDPPVSEIPTPSESEPSAPPSVVVSPAYYSLNLQDSKTGIIVSGQFKSNDAILEVSEKTEQRNNIDCIVYDITLKSSTGAMVQPVGEATVKIPVPNGWNAQDCKVYYENGNNRIIMNVSVDGNYIVFTTTHFSTYILSRTALSYTDYPSNQQIDVSDLSRSITGALTFPAENYTEASYNVLLEAVETAQNLINNPNATQEELDTALLNIQNAVGMLVHKNDTSVPDNGNNNNNNTGNTDNNNNNVTGNDIITSDGNVTGNVPVDPNDVNMPTGAEKQQEENNNNNVMVIVLSIVGVIAIVSIIAVTVLKKKKVK